MTLLKLFLSYYETTTECRDENLKEQLGDNSYNGSGKLSQGFNLTWRNMNEKERLTLREIL